MLKFLLGFAVAVFVLLTAGFCYVRFGFVDPRADLPIDWLESKIAMPSLDAAVDRRAPNVLAAGHTTSGCSISSLALSFRAP